MRTCRKVLLHNTGSENPALASLQLHKNRKRGGCGKPLVERTVIRGQHAVVVDPDFLSNGNRLAHDHPYRNAFRVGVRGKRVGVAEVRGAVRNVRVAIVRSLDLEDERRHTNQHLEGNQTSSQLGKAELPVRRSEPSPGNQDRSTFLQPTTHNVGRRSICCLGFLCGAIR